MSLQISYEPYQKQLAQSMLLLQRVDNIYTDLTEDLKLGLIAFKNAYKNASEEEIIENFGAPENIIPYYTKLFTEDDVKPFRKGEAVWIQAYFEKKLVGWMTLIPGFNEPNSVYLSTFVISPEYTQHGIARLMITSIREHWIPMVKNIYLITRGINRDAVNFFEQMKFTPISDIESHFLDDSKTCYFMVNTANTVAYH